MPSKTMRIVLAVLFVIACIGLRLLWLPLDPPDWLSWSSGVYTDEGFYTLDARSRVLFGTLAPGNFHDSYTAPLLSWIQTIWFRLFGIGMQSARALDMTLGLLTLALFWDMLRRRSPRGISTAATVMLGLSPIYLFYNCLALQETPALFWIVLALWLIGPLTRNNGGTGQNSPPAPNSGGAGLRDFGVALAGACIIAAYATKSLSMIAAPAVAVAVWSPLLSKERVRVRFLAFAIGLAVAGAGLIAVTWPHHAEIARMSRYYLGHQILPHTATSLWLNIRRGFVDPQKGVLPYLLATMPVSMILAAIAFRRSRPVEIDPVPVIWLACGLAFCLLSRYAPSRYYVLLMPALCWLAAIGWCGLPRPRLRQLALAAAVVVSLCWIGWSWGHRSSSLLLANTDLDNRVRPTGLVLGEFAPEVFDGMDVPTVPLQPGLSNDDHPIERLRPEYITVCRSPYWRGWWQARYPWLIDGRHRVGTVQLGGHGQYIVDIYKVNVDAH